jgi:hypothetical protein
MAKASDDLAKALRDFASSYRAVLEATPSDAAAKAQQTVDEAKRILNDGGVGIAFTHIVDAVAPWHAWIKRDDFAKWAAFPVSQVSASEVLEEGLVKGWVTEFSYKETPYQVRFSKGDYPYSRAELYVRGERLLGLDLAAQDGDKFPQEKWANVFALQIGAWMRDVIEMALHCQTKVTNSILASTENDAMSRASQIKL